MSGALTETASSSDLFLPHDHHPIESSSSSSFSFHSALKNNSNGLGVGERVEQGGDTVNPWKKAHQSHRPTAIQVMGTSSWPALSPHDQDHISKSVMENESVIVDTQALLVHSTKDNETITGSKANGCEKFISDSEGSSSAPVSSSPQDQVQESATGMENVTEGLLGSSFSSGSDSGCSANGYEEFVSNKEVTASATITTNHDDPSKIKLTVSISVENGNESGTHGSPSNMQRSLNNRSRQKSRPNQNQSHNSSFQNQRYSNRRHQPRVYNNRNSDWGYNDTRPVNWPNHMPGYVNGPTGFNGLPQSPNHPYTYPNFTSVNNPPPHANMPFVPVPYSFPPPIQHPGYVMPFGYYDNPYFTGGTSFYPQTAHPNDLHPDAVLCNALRRQIEHYFSEGNLTTDYFLRNHMDAYGWVSVDLIATFNKVKRMTRDTDLILASLQPSQLVEVQGKNMRKRGDWSTWILTTHGDVGVLQNKVENINLDARSEIEAKSIDASPSLGSSENSAD